MSLSAVIKASSRWSPWPPIRWTVHWRGMLSYIINLSLFCHYMLWIMKILPLCPERNMWFLSGSQSVNPLAYDDVSETSATVCSGHGKSCVDSVLSKMFFYLLDIVIYNAYVLYSKLPNSTKQSIVNYRLNIAEHTLHNLSVPNYPTHGRRSQSECPTWLQAKHWPHFRLIKRNILQKDAMCA